MNGQVSGVLFDIGGVLVGQLSSLVLGVLQLILRVQLILFKPLSAIRTVHVVAQRVFMHLEVTTAGVRIAFAADKTRLSRKHYRECLDAHLSAH
jgi:hypothetical protein